MHRVSVDNVKCAMESKVHYLNSDHIAGAIEFPPGLQPELCIRVFPPRPILTMALNPSAGLLSFGKLLILLFSYIIRYL